MIRTYNHFLFSFEFPEISETFRCRGSRATHSTVFILSQPNLISLMFIKIGGTLYITLVSTPFHIARIIYSILGYFSRRKNIASIIASLALRVFVAGLKMKMKKRACFGFQRERLGTKFVAS